MPDPIILTVTNGGGSDATLGEVSAQTIGLISPFGLDATLTTCATGMLLPQSGPVDERFTCIDRVNHVMQPRDPLQRLCARFLHRSGPARRVHLLAR